MKTALLQIFFNKFDIDAQAFINRVENADNQPLENNVKNAINQLVISLKNANLFNNASQILAPCGARTLSGALIPLRGVNVTNNGFVAADYNRKTGLGDGFNTTKWLNSNVAQNSLPSASHALAWYGIISTASGDRCLIGRFNNTSSLQNSLLSLDSTTAYVGNARAFRSANYASAPDFPIAARIAASCLIGSRTSLSLASLYQDGSVTSNSTTVAPSFESQSLGWFALNQQSGSPAVFDTSNLQIGAIYNQGLTATQAADYRSICATYVSVINLGI